MSAKSYMIVEKAIVSMFIVLMLLILWDDYRMQKVGVLPACSCFTQPCATTR